MKNIQKSVHFSPSVLIYFEQLSKQKKCSFSEAVNNYLEQSMINGKQELKFGEVLSAISEIQTTNIQIIEVLDLLVNKK